MALRFLIILDLILKNCFIAHVSSITCISYSGSTTYQSKTNVTGPGDSCCATQAYSGPNIFGVTYTPYDSLTQVCCKQQNNIIIGNTVYSFSEVGIGNACCSGKAYKSNQKCCTVYQSNSQYPAVGFGDGDTCCGTKPYFKDKQECCEGSVLGYTTYALGDGCCYGKTRPYNKSTHVCCNTWNIQLGNACCNENAEENPDEPYDIGYDKGKQCCVNGKILNQICTLNGLNDSFRPGLFIIIFTLILFT